MKCGKDKNLNDSRILEILSQLSIEVFVLHLKNIIHGNIRTETVSVDDGKLSSFETLMKVGQSLDKVSLENKIPKSQMFANDMLALGATMYEFCEQIPLPRNESFPHETVFPLKFKNKEVTLETKKIIGKLLSADRYTIEELVLLSPIRERIERLAPETLPGALRMLYGAFKRKKSSCSHSLNCVIPVTISACPTDEESSTCITNDVNISQAGMHKGIDHGEDGCRNKKCHDNNTNTKPESNSGTSISNSASTIKHTNVKAKLGTSFSANIIAGVSAGSNATIGVLGVGRAGEGAEADVDVEVGGSEKGYEAQYTHLLTPADFMAFLRTPLPVSKEESNPQSADEWNALDAEANPMAEAKSETKAGWSSGPDSGSGLKLDLSLSSSSSQSSDGVIVFRSFEMEELLRLDDVDGYTIQHTPCGTQCMFTAKCRTVFLNQAIPDPVAVSVYLWTIRTDCERIDVGYAPSDRVHLFTDKPLLGNKSCSFRLERAKAGAALQIELQGVREPPPVWKSEHGLCDSEIRIEVNTYMHTLALFVGAIKVPNVISFFKVRIPFHLGVTGWRGSSLTSVSFAGMSSEIDYSNPCELFMCI